MKTEQKLNDATNQTPKHFGQQKNGVRRKGSVVLGWGRRITDLMTWEWNVAEMEGVLWRGGEEIKANPKRSTETE